VEWSAELQVREQKLAGHYGIRAVYSVWPQDWWLNTLMRAARFSRRFPSFVCDVANQMIFALATRRKIYPGGLRDLNGLLDVSGYAYHAGGLPRTIGMTLVLREMKKRERKTVFLAQAYGPFDDKASRWWIKVLREQCPLFYSRDLVSTRHLTQAGISQEDVLESPDIALLFRGEESACGKAILEKAGCIRRGADQPLVGISANMRVFERTEGEGPDNHYVKTIKALIDHIIHDLDGSVVLVPNESLLLTNKPDDRSLNAMIGKYFETSERVIVLEQRMTAGETKAVIENLDFLVASRFHSLVFALSSGVPVLALGWSHKYHELLRLFGVEEFCLSHESFDQEQVLHLFNRGWFLRKELAERIEKNLPELQAKVHKIFDRIAENFRR
jgi:colanic acid/amylovoran biosynthesis protein